MVDPTTTVIIPSYGPSPHLHAVLKALHEGDLKPDEIIVSHSGSHDPSNWVRKNFPLVQIIHSSARRFAGEARNAGARNARHPVLAFCDSDVIPDHDWLRTAVENIADQPGIFLVGSVGYAISGGYWGLGTWITEFSEQVPWRPSGEQNGGASCNFICMAADLEKAGFFSESHAIGEDTLLFATLRSRGLRQIFLSSARVRHCNIPGFRNFRKHTFEHGLAFVSTRKNHDLPGSFAVRFWPISLILWGAKILKISGRVLESGSGRFCRLGYFLPAIVLGALIWQAGAIKSLLAKS